MQHNNRRGYPLQHGGQRGRRGYRQMREIPLTPELPLGFLIKELRSDDLASSAVSLRPVASITKCDIVATWNWTNAKHPEMLIPGEFE